MVVVVRLPKTSVAVEQSPIRVVLIVFGPPVEVNCRIAPKESSGTQILYANYIGSETGILVHLSGWHEEPNSKLE